MTLVGQHNRPGEVLERVRSYLSKVPELRRKLMVRVFDGDCSPRNAIKAKCYDCCGFEDIDANVYGCTSYNCPLWGFRPQRKPRTK